MTMKGFQGRKIDSAAKPRTVGEALKRKSDVIGYIPGTIIDEYNKFIDDDFEGNEVLKKYERSGIELAGSSSFMGAAMSMFLKKNYSDMELAILPELELARKNGFNTEGRYIDVGLVLRSLDKYNPYHARKIAEQTSADLEFPAVYWLRDTKLETDKKAPEGLSFVIDPHKAFSASALEKECKFNATDANGMPVQVEDGKRTSYVSQDGLCWLYLDGDLDLGSLGDGLAASDSSGRVVVKTKVAGDE